MKSLVWTVKVKEELGWGKVKVTQSCLTLCDPHRLYSPWSSPGQNTRVGSLSLLQGLFPTQGSNPGLPHYRQILYQLSHKGSPGWRKERGKTLRLTGMMNQDAEHTRVQERTGGKRASVSHVNSNRLVVAQCRGISKICQGQEVRKWGQGSPVNLRLKDLCVTENKHTWISEVRSGYFCLESQAENVELSLVVQIGAFRNFWIGKKYQEVFRKRMCCWWWCVT